MYSLGFRVSKLFDLTSYAVSEGIQTGFLGNGVTGLLANPDTTRPKSNLGINRGPFWFKGCYKRTQTLKKGTRAYSGS